MFAPACVKMIVNTDAELLRVENQKILTRILELEKKLENKTGFITKLFDEKFMLINELDEKKLKLLEFEVKRLLTTIKNTNQKFF